MLNDIQQEKALTALVAITDAAVRLAGAGLTEQADWAGKQAALLTSALARRYWEEPQFSDLPGNEVADRGIALGEHEAKVVEVEEAHEVGGAVSWREEFGRITELTVLPVDGVALPATGEGAGVEALDGSLGQMVDEEVAPTRHRVPRKRSRG